MSKITKRVLFIDDELKRYHNIDNLFLTQPHVEFAYAIHWQEALLIVEDWLKQGFSPDLISIDEHHGQYEQGIKAIYERLQEHPEGKLPKHVTIHSGELSFSRQAVSLYNQEARNNNWPESSVADTEEFMELIRYTDDVVSGEDVDRSDFYRIDYREVCNKVIGTDFPLSYTSMKYLSDKANKKIEPQPYHEISELFLEKAAPFDELMANLDASDGFIVQDNLSYERSTEEKHSFKDFIGAPTVGRVVYSAEDIAQQKENYPKDKLILVLEKFEPKDIELIGQVDAVVYLDDTHEHLKDVCANLGVTGIFGTYHDGMYNNCFVKIDDGKLTTTSRNYIEHEDNWEEIHTQHHAGDFISLDCYYSHSITKGKEVKRVNAYLIPKKLNYEEYSFDRYNHGDENSLYSACEERIANFGIKTKANADNARFVEKALDEGANGIGLVRTEHMLDTKEKIHNLQSLVLSGSQDALVTLKNDQYQDILALYKASLLFKTEPNITIRLLDAPLDQFFTAEQEEKVIAKLGEGYTRGQALAQKVTGLYEAQIEAIFEAAEQSGYKKDVEILVPYVQSAEDMVRIRALCDERSAGRSYKLGAMVEIKDLLENGVLESVVEESDFLSIGTNDLTSSLMDGVKRNEFDSINAWMIENGVRGDSPFNEIHSFLEDAIKEVVTRARIINPEIDITACGRQMSTDKRAMQVAINTKLSGISVAPQYIEQSKIMGAFYLAAKEQDNNVTQASQAQAVVRKDGLKVKAP